MSVRRAPDPTVPTQAAKECTLRITCEDGKVVDVPLDPWNMKLMNHYELVALQAVPCGIRNEAPGSKDWCAVYAKETRGWFWAKSVYASGYRFRVRYIAQHVFGNPTQAVATAYLIAAIAVE